MVDSSLYYGDVAGFKQYCEDHAYDVPATVDDDQIIGSLLVASEWLDGHYRAAFMAPLKGQPMMYRGTYLGDIGTYKSGRRAQVREWPRTGFIDSYGDPIANDEIPREIISATYEVAFRQCITPGALWKDFTLGAYRQVSIDGAVSVTYNVALSAADIQLQIPAVDAILSALLGSIAGVQGGLSGPIARM